MLKRVSALILSAATLAACSESTAPIDRTSKDVPSAGQQSLLAELTCTADVAARRLSCGPESSSLSRAISPDLILGGQTVYVLLASGPPVVWGTDSLTAEVTVKNLTAQPWATADGVTPAASGVRVFAHTLPAAPVTIDNPDGFQTYTASNQPYFQYKADTLGVDQILSSGEVTLPKHWRFALNGATTFSFKVFIVATMPDESGVLRWTPSTVSQTGSFEQINAIWGSGPSDVWVGGTNGNSRFHHWDGASWTASPGANSTVDVTGMWGSSSTNVYAVGNTKIEQWDGANWTDVTSGTTNPLLAIWGSSATDIYAGGLSGTLVHSTGGAFSSVSSTGIGVENVSAIWGSSSSDVYVGASNVYHYNGTAWSTVSTGLGVDVRAIWGSSASDVWIGGTGGKMVHYNGTSWSSVTTLGSDDVGGIWGTSASDVYMVNRGGEIWHYNGSSWVSYSISSAALLGVWGSGRTDIWAVGTDNGFEFNRAYHGTR
jgi:hypothetical protein